MKINKASGALRKFVRLAKKERLKQMESLQKVMKGEILQTPAFSSFLRVHYPMFYLAFHPSHAAPSEGKAPTTPLAA